MTTDGNDARSAARLEDAIRLKRAAARSRATRTTHSVEGTQIPPRPVDQTAGLGANQRSLWLQHQLEPNSAAYHVVSAFRLSGQLDFPALERSLVEVVQRHRILRSNFRLEGGRLVQVVHDQGEIAVERVGCEPGGALPTAVRVAHKPFNLEIGPLVRLLLVEEPEGDERILALVLHHILADERSLALLWEEVGSGYRAGAFSDGDRLQYDDYVCWLAGRPPEEQAADLAFWRHQLDPLPGDLMLPFERKVDGSAPRGRFLHRVVGNRIQRQIRYVASATGTTPFTVLAFAFRLLLHRYTDGRHLAFATPASTRSHPATARMIGYFLNPVVISAAIDEGLSVKKAIAGFASHVRECLTHASLPFDRLVEELSPPRARGRHPIFQTMFVYQETPPPPDLGEARPRPVTLDLGESKFDLTLFASEGSDSLEIAAEYRVDRFEESSMQRLLGHYETLLGHLEDGIEGHTAELPLLPLDERETVLGFAQGPTPEVAAALTVPQQILEQARRSGQAPAVVDADEEWTYGELELRARRVAHALMRCGVEPGARVGLFVDRSRLMIAGILGIQWAGGAYVPLDPGYPEVRNKDALEDAAVAAVVTRTALRERLLSASLPTVTIDALNVGQEIPDLPAMNPSGEIPAYVLYTSGSTGRPKGVVVTHENLRASTAARRQVYGSVPKRFLLLPSVAFDSSVAGIFWTLSEGGTLIIPSDDEAKDPRRLAQQVAANRVTDLLCVPSLYAHILAAGEDSLQLLETVIVAGESCPPGLVNEHFRRLPQARLFNEYGPTEATVWATVHEIERRDHARPNAGTPIPIGRPIPGVRVEVLDALGRPVPAGVPGEGWISGPTVAQGYWGRQESTDERFVTRDLEDGSERAFRSGDRMTWTAGGELLFLGRVDEQIKLRGFRIEPGEIESVLVELPGMEEAAVIAHSETQLVAFAVTSGPVDAWREELATRLPDFMVPSRLVEVSTLPHLPNGKIDRSKLQDIEIGTEPPAASTPGILSDLENTLVSLWEGLLGRTGIGSHDNFFQLGGHSLLVVEMTAAIEKDLSVTLPPADVFQNPTVRELAARIEDEGVSETSSYAHLFPIQPGGGESPFVFSIPHFFSGMVAARFRGERPVYGLRGVGLRPEGNRGRWRTMRELGEELVEEITRRFPKQPVIMAGYSFGATMAVEAVRLMENQGIAVERLYLIAPMPVDFYRLGPFRVQIDGLRQPLEELSFGQTLRHFLRGNNPLTLRPYRRAWRLLAVQPWRRLVCLAGRLRTLAGLPLTPGILHADVRVERFRLHAGYRPGVLETPTVIFNAREPETDAAATWRPYFSGELTVYDIPDPHLDEPSIQAAKQAILRHLRDLGDR